MAKSGSWNIKGEKGGKSHTTTHRGDILSLLTHVGDLMVLYPENSYIITPVIARLTDCSNQRR